MSALISGVPDGARALLAVGLLADDVTPAGISRYAQVHVAEAEEALDTCRRHGVLADDGTVEPAVRAGLLADLPVERRAEIHARVARHLMAAGPSQLVRAVEHARAAGTLVPLEELVAMADRGGRMNLSLHDYDSARQLLALAAELDVSGDQVQIGNRLCDLASASDGLGLVSEAREMLARAAALGEIAGNGELVARAAVGYAMPVDWYAGDSRSTALLQRAEAMPLTEGQLIMVRAARALVEMRIPIDQASEHQVAWVTRPGVAHRLAEEALEESAHHPGMVRGIALQAWRATHRSPSQLARRREVATEALDVAQELRQPHLQVEAAVWLAVDAIESADRPLYDEALTVARWVAERDGNPRLQWRAHTLGAGAAFLDGDYERAAEMRTNARRVGEAINSPGWFGAEIFFYGQDVISRDDLDEMEAMTAFFDGDDYGGFVNPLGRAMGAYVFARLGRHDTAIAHVRRAMRQFDAEASYLVLGTRLAHVLHVLGEDAPRELIDDLHALLEPWRSHVAVDSNAWLCDGPVSAWLALLDHQRGRFDAAVDAMHEADVLARSINDVRTLARLSRLSAVLETTAPLHRSTVTSDDASRRAPALTDRELQVLEMLAAGATNSQIARSLAYSISTIRADTMSIYRKLGAKGRVDAVTQALTSGLLASPTGD